MPTALRRLLKTLSERLFDPRLNVTTWRRWSGVRDNGVSREFKSWFGVPLKAYYCGLRLETAGRMLAATDLDERQIGDSVGFICYRTFERYYTKWIGHKPTEGRDRPAPTIGPVMMSKASRGLLTSKEFEWFVAELRRLHPHAVKDSTVTEGAGEPPERTIVDGSEYEAFLAGRVWEKIQARSREEQERLVRGYEFHSTALFDLLRKKSREEGRKDRARGVDLARLALVSLEGHDAVFGERIHDLRALGWAWLANTRCLQLDLSGAVADLVNTHNEWSMPRVMKDLDISAEIHFLESAIRMCQRRYPEALELADESIRIAKLTSDAVGEAKALTVRASVKGYMERLQDSSLDLQQAAELIEDETEPFLAFMINLNQGNVCARLGEPDAAAMSLAKATACSEQIDYPMGVYEIRHVEANLCELAGQVESAEALYIEALEGFLCTNEPGSAALVSLELAHLDSCQGRFSRALDLASWSLPIFQSMKLHEETAVVVKLLARESAACRIDQVLLAEVARLLGLDPLLRLGQQAKAGDVSQPSCLNLRQLLPYLANRC